MRGATHEAHASVTRAGYLEHVLQKLQALHRNAALGQAEPSLGVSVKARHRLRGVPTGGKQVIHAHRHEITAWQ